MNLRFLFFLEALICSALISRAAWAANVAGTLVAKRSADGIYLLKHDGKLPPVPIAAESGVMDILKSLRDGSFIIGTGETRLGVLHLDSVQTVGLPELLGAWKTTDSEVFEFRDFKNVALYLPIIKNGEYKIQFRETLNYVLTPDKENMFSIFMTDSRKSMVVGTLELTPDRRALTLNLYDSESGRQSQKLSLSPLFLK